MIREAYITPLNLQQVYTLERCAKRRRRWGGRGAPQGDKAPSKVTLLNPNREFGDGVEDTLIITSEGDCCWHAEHRIRADSGGGPSAAGEGDRCRHAEHRMRISGVLP